jgi:hypothetical protein
MQRPILRTVFLLAVLAAWGGGARAGEPERVARWVAAGRTAKAEARCVRIVARGGALEGTLREACATAELARLKADAERTGDVAPLEEFRARTEGTEAANVAYQQAARVHLGWSVREPDRLWALLENYPNAAYAPQARVRLWEGVRARRDVEEVRRFQSLAPDSVQARLARSLEGDLRYAEALADGSTEAVEGFLAEFEFGGHRHVADARRRVATARFSEAGEQDPRDALATAEAFGEHPDAAVRKADALARIAVVRTLAPARAGGLTLQVGGRVHALPGGAVIDVTAPELPVGPVEVLLDGKPVKDALLASVGSRAGKVAAAAFEPSVTFDAGQANVVLPELLCGAPEARGEILVTVAGAVLRYPFRPESTCDSLVDWRAPRLALEVPGIAGAVRFGMSSGAFRRLAPGYRGSVDLQGVTTLCTGAIDDVTCADFYRDALFAVRQFCRGFASCASTRQQAMRRSLALALRPTWSVDVPLVERVYTAPNSVAFDVKDVRFEDGSPEGRIAVLDLSILAAFARDTSRYDAWRGATRAPLPGTEMVSALRASSMGVLPEAATERAEVVHGRWCTLHGGVSGGPAAVRRP